VLAAHCLVNKDVPPYSVGVGVPVKVIRNRVEDARARADEEAARAVALADIARKTELARQEAVATRSRRR